MNAGKYYLDSENCTPEEREWVKDQHYQKNGSTIGFSKSSYYLFDNCEYINDYSYLDNNYPLYTVQQLKNLINGVNIYECW